MYGLVKETEEDIQRSFSRGRRGIAGSMVFDNMNSTRIMQHIADEIRQVCEPYVGRINDDSAYWSMVAAARNTVSEAMNEGIIAQAGVRVDADTSVVTVEYQPTMSVERMIVSVNLNA